MNRNSWRTLLSLSLNICNVWYSSSSWEMGGDRLYLRTLPGVAELDLSIYEIILWYCRSRELFNRSPRRQGCLPEQKKPEANQPPLVSVSVSEIYCYQEVSPGFSRYLRWLFIYLKGFRAGWGCVFV